MKKYLLAFMAMALLFSVACTKEDENDGGKPGDVTITQSVNGNTVTFTASATDAVKYVWDLGNGEAPIGASVIGTYLLKGDYTVKCTAKGREEDNSATTSVKIDANDPMVEDPVFIAVSGFDMATGEANAKWMWLDEAGAFSCGPSKTNGDDTSYYFDPIDDTWWQCGTDEIDPAALDDEYFFKVNSSMEYVNDFKDAFMVNWSWMAANYGVTVDVWVDHAYESYEAPASSWSIKHYEENYNLGFTTSINGTDLAGAYTIALTNGADLGIEAKETEYQIVSIENNIMWIRYDNASPDNLYDVYGNPDDLTDEGITAGEPEWGYFKLQDVNAK